MELLLQFVVLGFTFTVWWLAKKDLTARAAKEQAGDSAALESLKLQVETLTEELENRANMAEAKLTETIAEARSLAAALNSVSMATDNDRFAPALALAESGVNDPAELARRTGLGRGEIELLLRLRMQK